MESQPRAGLAKYALRMVLSPGGDQAGLKESNRRFIFFVNPRARFGRAEKRFAGLWSRFPKPALRAETIVIRSREDMRRPLASLSPGTVPVACGGDGTVQALARALFESGLLHREMGVLPLGYGNAFACALGIRSEMKAVRTLLDGEVRRLDIMTTDHPQAPVVLVSLSVGFESLFLARFARLRALPRPAGAILSLLASARGSYRGIVMRLHRKTILDHCGSVYNAGLYNMPSYAFDWRLPPEKDPEDGRAEAVIARTAFVYWKMLLGAFLGRRREAPKRLVCQSWQEACLESPWPLQADGESISPGAFAIALRPGSLSVLAPPRPPPTV